MNQHVREQTTFSTVGRRSPKCPSRTDLSHKNDNVYKLAVSDYNKFIIYCPIHFIGHTLFVDKRFLYSINHS